MKRTFSTNKWFVVLALILVVALAACERPLQDEPEPTEVPDVAPTVPQPLLPTQPAQPPTDLPPDGEPTADPNAQPTLPPDGVGAQPTPGSPNPVPYVIQPGDTLFSIAQQYNVTVEDLAAANGIDPNGLLTPGQTLTIPVGGVVATPAPVPPPAGQERTHTIQSGENLFRIGLQYGCSVNELAAYNGIANPDWISAGQVIRIPATCTGS